MKSSIVRISEEIMQVKVPLPFPLRWVNSYLLRGTDGWTLLDPGIHTQEAVQFWQSGLKHAGIALSEIRQIVLTHHHPDHYGLSGWFQQQCEVPVLISRSGLEQTELLWGERRTLTDALMDVFIKNGLEAGETGPMREHMEAFIPLVSPPPQLTVVDHGQRVDLGILDCMAIETAGHAKGHLSFWHESGQKLFCGDHLLPQISPNISFLPGIDDNPLASFLDGLQLLAELPSREVYPGHREPFADAAGRARELAAHHEERLDRFLSLMDTPKTAYTLCREMFGSRLSLHQLRFALAETIAHLVYLEQKGSAMQEEIRGTIVYSR